MNSWIKVLCSQHNQVLVVFVLVLHLYLSPYFSLSLSPSYLSHHTFAQNAFTILFTYKLLTLKRFSSSFSSLGILPDHVSQCNLSISNSYSLSLSLPLILHWVLSVLLSWPGAPSVWIGFLMILEQILFLSLVQHHPLFYNINSCIYSVNIYRILSMCQEIC